MILEPSQVQICAGLQVEQSPCAFLLFLGHCVPCCLLEVWKVVSSTLIVLCSSNIVNTISYSESFLLLAALPSP